MKTLIALRCPRCGADINVADDREFIFCEYCGSKILLDNDHEYTIHTIDEAKIRKVEADREVRMRRVEAERDGATAENQAGTGRKSSLHQTYHWLDSCMCNITYRRNLRLYH